MKSLKYKKIVFFSGSRAELDLTTPVIKYLKMKNIKKFKIFFIVSGTHLSKFYGNSGKSIKSDLTIYKKIKLIPNVEFAPTHLDLCQNEEKHL